MTGAALPGCDNHAADCNASQPSTNPNTQHILLVHALLLIAAPPARPRTSAIQAIGVGAVARRQPKERARRRTRSPQHPLTLRDLRLALGESGQSIVQYWCTTKSPRCFGLHAHIVAPLPNTRESFVSELTDPHSSVACGEGAAVRRTVPGFESRQRADACSAFVERNEPVSERESRSRENAARHARADIKHMLSALSFVNRDAQYSPHRCDRAPCSEGVAASVSEREACPAVGQSHCCTGSSISLRRPTLASPAAPHETYDHTRLPTGRRAL